MTFLCMKAFVVTLNRSFVIISHSLEKKTSIIQSQCKLQLFNALVDIIIIMLIKRGKKPLFIIL